jgi:anti-anti-sigma factor
MTSSGASLTATVQQDGVAVLTLRGTVDAACAREAERLVRHDVLDRNASLIIDVSGADEITGALLGLLVRATRKLSWRNRRLVIVCTRPELRRRLEMAGIDELADVIAEWPEGAV